MQQYNIKCTILVKLSMVNTIAKPPDNKERSRLHSCRKRLKEGEDTLESWTGPEPSLPDFCTELNGGQNITPHQPKAAHNSQPVKVAGWYKGNKQVANRSSSFGRAQFHKQAAKTCQYYHWNSHSKHLNHSFTWNSRVLITMRKTTQKLLECTILASTGHICQWQHSWTLCCKFTNIVSRVWQQRCLPLFACAFSPCVWTYPFAYPWPSKKTFLWVLSSWFLKIAKLPCQQIKKYTTLSIATVSTKCHAPPYKHNLQRNFNTALSNFLEWNGLDSSCLF